MTVRAAIAADRTSGVDRALRARPPYGVPSEPATILGVGDCLGLAVQCLLMLRTLCPPLFQFHRRDRTHGPGSDYACVVDDCTMTRRTIVHRPGDLAEIRW
jgi:hypothetical protein